MLKISRKSSSLRIQESFQTHSPAWTQLFQRNCRSKSLRLIALFGKSLFVKAGLKLLSNFFNHVIVTSGSSRPVASWSLGNKLVRGIQVAGIDRTPFIVYFLFHFVSSANCYIAFLQKVFGYHPDPAAAIISRPGFIRLLISHHDLWEYFDGWLVTTTAYDSYPEWF